MSQTNGKPPAPSNGARVQVVNLGCAKNEVDAEEMLGVLSAEGYRVDGGGAADAVVINTCGFIEDAKRESIDAILAAVARKQAGEVRRVVVAGCLSQRYARELAAEIPEVDVFVGAGGMGAIGGVVGEALADGGRRVQVDPRPHHRWVDAVARVRAGSPWRAWLKIGEGCNHRCTFCAIPAMRGRHVSKPLERVVAEAAALAAQGARELNLVAQDSTQYGYDLYGRPALPDLLSALSGVEGVDWVRVFYCYPSRVNQAVIRAISGTPRVCRYVDMPLQHADDAVLRAMRRPGTRDGYLRLLERFRAAAPDVAIRTTFIVGFPGETDAQFENLLRFVEEARFDRAGAFEYSAEDGTPAAALPGRVPLRVRRERHAALMELQRGISLERNREWLGRDIDVLVERTVGPDAVGRSFRDAPEIDGTVTVRGCRAAPGTMVRARVTDASEYHLAAEPRPA